MKHNTTKKNREIGGDIHRRKIFENILSIGYELETSSLSKLTLISDTTENGDSILLNTDTARNDLETFQKKLSSSSEEEDFEVQEEEEDEDFILRQEELVKIDAYNKQKQVDKNVSFLVTNDIVESPFIKFLNKKCGSIEEEMLYDKKDEDDASKIEFKNNLYSFLDETGKKYQFQFVFHDIKTPCSVFSDVEWIFTYYKPKQSGNIIIDTFANAIYNLLLHVRDLKPVKGTFFINTCVPLVKGGDASITKTSLSRTNCKIVANRPEKRILYHKPGTNMYYLQTHYYDKELTIKDVCITPQMTFSAHISNIIPIMKQMINDTIRSIPSTTNVLEHRYEMLNNIEFIVNLLLEEYNRMEPEYQITIIPSNLSSKGKEPEKNTLYKSIKSYLFLIFYKLFLFYNSYHGNAGAKYFKDSLFFNSRHSNYILYDALKKSIHAYFSYTSVSVSDDKIVEIIQKICVQSVILEKHLVTESTTKIRKNVFDIRNKLEKNASSYGNPAKSLISYFHFFEDPIDTESNIGIDGTILYHDYLEYKRIDAYSAKMDLKSDIVLVEFRVFTRLLSSYIYSISGETTREKMTRGICNEMTKNFQPDIRGLSLSVLSDFYRHYHHSNPKSRSKSKNKSKTRSKSKSKTEK